MTKIYWQPSSNDKLKELFRKTYTLKKQDRAVLARVGATHVGREALVIPELVKSCIFFSLGDFHKKEGDYITTTTDYFYSIFHSAVAIYKAHFDCILNPEKEFNPNKITVKRKKIHDFVIRLSKEELISENYKRTYTSLQDRRDHVVYQPRVVLGGKHKIITFFTCQFENLVSYLEKTRIQLFNAILEAAELIGHVLYFYHHHLDDAHKELLATMMLKNWSNICIKTYQYWGSSVEMDVRKGMKFHWNASVNYKISDKTRKPVVPAIVIETTQKEIKEVLELMRANFLSPRIRFQE